MITAKKETYGGQPYTSGKITTFNKFTQLYGKIEARIKLPLGQGTWPAFWMLGNNINTVNWPTCGEIDIMEHVNTDNIIYGTMHWNNNGHVSYGHTTTTTAGDYHIYAVEWDTSSIRWYVDSTLYQTGTILNNVNATDAFHLPFFIILNLAMGGDFQAQQWMKPCCPKVCMLIMCGCINRRIDFLVRKSISFARSIFRTSRLPDFRTQK